MIILRESGKPYAAKPVYLTEAQIGEMKKRGLFEASNLPAIAKTSGVSANPKIINVIRQDTIFNTVKAMGVKVKINAMQNVVAEDMPDQQTAAAVATTIYKQFGVRCSFTVTYEGSWKCYWSPKAPVEQATALTYAKAAGLPPLNLRRYLA
jgi:hypothetical protein